ncbi:MAG: branched-chain amino acid ABC transporter permease [Bradyrhizobium sp.]
MPGRLPGSSTLIVYLAVLLLLPIVVPSVPLATEIAIMTLATLSCHLLLVYGPLLSFGQGAFFGIGAYLGGLYAIGVGPAAPFGAVIAILVGGLGAAVAALLVGMVALRRIAGLGGHGAGGVTFLMLTFAVAQVAYFVAYNAPQLTGGENGLLNIPRLSAGLSASDFTLTDPTRFYVFCAVVVGVVVVLVDRFINSTAGQAFRAVGENERRASAIGYDVFTLRLTLFVAAGAIAGISGALYAMFLGLVPLSAIDLIQSERIVIMTALGGTGSILGAIVGTICFVLGSDLLSRVWPHWPFALGAAIVIVVFFARGGVLGLIENVLRALRGSRQQSETVE